MTKEKRDAAYIVPALQKALRILEMFSGEQRSLTVSDFARHLDVSASSIYRIVYTLTEMGYLTKVARNTYELGPQVISRGFSYLASREILEVAVPHINRLRDDTSMSSHLAIREGTEAIYIYRALAPQRVSVNVPVGSRFPCHTIAIGRMLLTDLTDDEVTALYQGKRIDGHPPPAPQTLPELKDRIAQDRATGWALDYSDYSTAIAAPIRNYAGQVVAAINVSGPDTVMYDDGVQETLTRELLKRADMISAELGGTMARIHATLRPPVGAAARRAR